MRTKITKSEQQFIKELEQKVQEQARVVQTEILPDWARGVGEWLTVNPWRVLVPLAGIVYLVARIMYGRGVREIVLGIFGGF